MVENVMNALHQEATQTVHQKLAEIVSAAMIRLELATSVAMSSSELKAAVGLTWQQTYWAARASDNAGFRGAVHRAHRLGRWDDGTPLLDVIGALIDIGDNQSLADLSAIRRRLDKIGVAEGALGTSYISFLGDAEQTTI